jgi:predicted transcriptional regulator
LNKTFKRLNQDVQKCCIKYRPAIHPAVQQNYRRAKKLLIVRKHEKTAKTNRSRYEIMAGIVQNCLSPRRKTHIMYKNSLSFAQTNAYLSLLISLGLLTQQNSEYETTDKGRQFISAYNHLGEIMGIPALSITGMSVFSSYSAPTNR